MVFFLLESFQQTEELDNPVVFGLPSGVHQLQEMRLRQQFLDDIILLGDTDVDKTSTDDDLLEMISSIQNKVFILLYYSVQ